MRVQGAIEHAWFDDFIRHDGNRYFIWGGRPGRTKGWGMPAFPRGRAAPAFPRIGPAPQVKDPLLDPVSTPRSWYARWTARIFGLSNAHGARLARQLLERLAHADVLQTAATNGGGTVFIIPASSVLIAPTANADLASGRHLLTCDVCHAEEPGTAAVVDQLEDAPCLLVRCPGVLRREERDDNYYRSLYASSDMRRIVAREHTSLLDDDTRLEYETKFKAAISDPGAPNVLVATPTLEMGIDIGDLSAVLLASLPKTVASYVQRVGRAGRLTGSGLYLAFITGRGENLPRLADPLSVINGQVRAPATYLSAEEILRRQYVACLADCFARDDSRPHPRRARGALGSAEPRSFLGDLIHFGEDDAAGHLGRFLGGFDNLAPAAVDNLRAWATAKDGAPNSSGLAAHLMDASRRWLTIVESLYHRRAAIQAALPGLEHVAGLPAASDDDKRAAKSAKAALKVIGFDLGRLQGKHWIAVLEEFGILPNYTLLDDTVTLGVAVTWIDPDSGEYRSEPVSFTRTSGNALREFAPGATFYARGLEINIDAVELGPEDSAIRPMTFCPACGYALDLGTLDPGTTPSTVCPRCGGPGLSGTEQRLDAVELTRVSAQLRRDEAAISDRNDDRKRENFTVVIAADVDAQYVARQWYVTDYDFGVKYLRRLTVRWVNLGRLGAGGATRQLAGKEGLAPLFRVCAGCGVLDRNTGVNQPEEHRAWCRYRKSNDEHVRNIALTRTLTTQGAVIRLPQTVTLGDLFAIPSMGAALLLGLHEQVGGSPDHIALASITEPVAGMSGATSEALLLHDNVPGGTGYLAELANPERMWDLLHRAWVRVRDCPCQHEARLACHRCLIPFAGNRVEHVSRSAAERHLRAILTSGSPTYNGQSGTQPVQPSEDMSWVLTEHEPEPVSFESHLEQSFRKVFTERVTALGAIVHESPGPLGNRLSIAFPGGTRQWVLDPQVQMGTSRPDFVLRSNQGTLPAVAIFTDGWFYHASPAHNRIADDARKRQDLRDSGAIVLGITARDVEHAQRGTFAAPGWLNDGAVAILMSSDKFRPQTVEAIRRGPIDFLLAWIQQPDVESQQGFADLLPLLFAQHAAHFAIDPEIDLAREAAQRLVDPHQGTPVGDASVSGWWWTFGPLGLLTRASAEIPAMGGMETALVIDDRADRLAGQEPTADGWREWLRIANALALRGQAATITAVSVAIGQEAVADSKHRLVTDKTEEVPAGWEVAHDSATVVERAFLVELARLLGDEQSPAPVIGHEENGLPIDIAWPEAKIAIFLELDELDPEDKRELELAEWQLFPASDPGAVRAALRKAA
jgi:hypothetical protein